MLWTTQTGSVASSAGSSTAFSGAIGFQSGSSNAKGAWNQMIAATTYTAYGLYFTDREPKSENAQDQAGLIDIGVGGSGSERVIVPNLITGDNGGPVTYFLPILIPGGSRIAVRAQNANASTKNTTGIMTLGASAAQPVLGRATDYGTVTASSGGTAVYTGTLAANTKSPWTQLVASTTAPIRYLLPMIQIPAGTSIDTFPGLVDIGVGGSGSESVIFPDISVRGTLNELGLMPVQGAWIDVPAGSRLSARWQYDNANPTSSVAPRVSVIGFG